MDPPPHRCNSCNIDIPPTATTLLCPNCNSPLNPNPNPNHHNQTLISTVTASDDNFLLDSPYLHRLIHHLTHTTTTSRYHSPTSKSAIESIPLIKITSEFLSVDPVVLCAICKDQFVINDEAKRLPCKHIYHPDCILPWLCKHNSCPVCRFELPREDIGKVSRRLVNDDDHDDVVMLGVGFRNLHHHYLQSEVDGRIGRSVGADELPDSESVSGWRNWPVNGGGENVDDWANWNANPGDVDEALRIWDNHYPSQSHTT